MAFAVAWILIIVPALALAWVWRHVIVRWHDAPVTISGLISLSFTTASALVAIVAIAWVQIVGPLGLRDYRVEGWGLLLTVAGIVAGFSIREKNQHRHFEIVAAAALWLLLLYGMSALSY